ncbi:MBL fold metallo-hydrolase [Marispirochaeta sp.]|uniref:MBL fold metallo-hydrolase n=1 Tax=Marispirochaeta sp. TaxID=2038653 RepID=UPI0029C6885B|nr:MBL fold metallo-hydrolase [Marispirochaeta sp.]
MKVRFWGVRGSIPTPLSSRQIQSRIAAVVQRIEPHHLENQQSRERFLHDLPPYIMGTVGGNTTCLEVRLKDNTTIIIDAGSGIRELGAALKKQGEHIRVYHILFTHFHWDHIQGLPFFAPQVYDPRCEIHFYSPVPNLKAILEEQMQKPYFPISMESMNAVLFFHKLKGNTMDIGPVTVSWRPMKHPGNSYSYKIQEEDSAFIFSSDTELVQGDFIENPENTAFYRGVDSLIMDSQYTLDEAIEKYDWGHSSYSLAVDFAVTWGIRKLYLFHHEPQYDDKKLYSIEQSARWYLNHQKDSNLEIYSAIEGMEFEL